MKLQRYIINNKDLVGSWIKDDIYHVSIYIFFGKGIQQYIDDNYPEFSGLNFSAGKSFNQIGKSVYFIWVKKIEDFDTLCHECLHTVFFIMTDRSIKIDPENDEPITYYFGALIREIIKFKSKHGSQS